jgi:hypothetical protein
MYKHSAGKYMFRSNTTDNYLCARGHYHVGVDSNSVNDDTIFKIEGTKDYHLYFDGKPLSVSHSDDHDGKGLFRDGKDAEIDIVPVVNCEQVEYVEDEVAGHPSGTSGTLVYSWGVGAEQSSQWSITAGASYTQGGGISLAGIVSAETSLTLSVSGMYSETRAFTQSARIELRINTEPGVTYKVYRLALRANGQSGLPDTDLVLPYFRTAVVPRL